MSNDGNGGALGEVDDLALAYKKKENRNSSILFKGVLNTGEEGI